MGSRSAGIDFYFWGYAIDHSFEKYIFKLYKGEHSKCCFESIKKEGMFLWQCSVHGNTRYASSKRQSFALFNVWDSVTYCMHFDSKKLPCLQVLPVEIQAGILGVILNSE